MVDLDDDAPQASICVDCARHSSLKRLIASNAVPGLCGLCEREDVNVCDPRNTNSMVMLLRSLVRFYWDEYDYNPHWGGESVMALFGDPDNPVLEPPRSDRYYDEIDYLIQEPVYPPLSEGVWLYAGFNDGIRLMSPAISRTNPMQIGELKRRLLVENFFQVEPDLDRIVSEFLGDIELQLPVNELWYRARIGQKNVFSDVDGWNSRIVRQPWMGLEIGAPPPLLAGNGRLNRTGVSMLYLATDVYTAVAEIRPHPGHHVSIGGFRSTQNLKLADFNPDISKFSSSDIRLDLFALIQAFDRLMSRPITPEEKHHYLLTQLLSEVLIKKGFDGVRYRSSLSKGSNICIFYPDRFTFDPSVSEVRSIRRVSYEVEATPYAITPTAGHFKLRDAS
jgi:hypothetical protein